LPVACKAFPVVFEHVSGFGGIWSSTEFLQDEVAHLKKTLGTMDEFVSKTESALTLEQALNEANKLQKDNVVDRMESLVSQVLKQACILMRSCS
jgi:hypothetical protein